MPDDQHFIDGVYNYCDGWCERCPFMSRCRNYATRGEIEEEVKAREEENRKFWKDLGIDSDLSISLPVQCDDADEDLDSGPAIDDNDFELQEDRTKAHPAVEMAREYMDATRDWTKRHKLGLEEEALEESGERSPPESRPIATFEDALEVVLRYNMFIYAKSMRAISGLYEDNDPFPEMPSDSDGSAKIALIAMDRSVAAWNLIAHEKPEFKKEITRLVLLLVAARRNLEEALPNARDFQRPGFDDPEFRPGS